MKDEEKPLLKKLTIFVLTAGILFTPISPLATETASAAQSMSNYDIAVQQGNNLKGMLSIYDSAINSGDIYSLDLYYDDITSGIRDLEVKIGKVQGATNRENLAKKYLVPAKIAIERTIYEVSQLRLLYTIDENIIDYDLDKAESNTAKLERLKQRAIDIKEEGGYAALPAAIDRELRSYEANSQGFLLSERLFEYADEIDYYEDIEAANQLYDNLSKQLKLTQQKIGKVSGASNREDLNEIYVLPAKMELERTIYEISQYRLLLIIEEDLYMNADTEKAQSGFAKLERLKNRAVEIKQSGGYDELPGIEQSLREMEQSLLDYLATL
jgi:SbsC C-terminal domain